MFFWGSRGYNAETFNLLLSTGIILLLMLLLHTPVNCVRHVMDVETVKICLDQRVCMGDVKRPQTEPVPGGVCAAARLHVVILFVLEPGRESLNESGVLESLHFQVLLQSDPTYCSSLTFHRAWRPCHSFTDNCFLTSFFFFSPLLFFFFFSPFSLSLSKEAAFSLQNVNAL